jgi:hypothetical protein
MVGLRVNDHDLELYKTTVLGLPEETTVKTFGEYHDGGLREEMAVRRSWSHGSGIHEEITATLFARRIRYFSPRKEEKCSLALLRCLDFRVEGHHDLGLRKTIFLRFAKR